MLCWWVVGALALLQTVGLAGRVRGRRCRRGAHRGRDGGAMRDWPGDKPL
ncbi:hypothetical protein LQ327_26710 [Actinomycetospora endophytica]|uniref:Uncharacterized protein n=1 Tax=Actinomycetospora endophytica TaxID=2291215 RepID=A0ABS8PFB9_9PSEU|nr:hypothetical protein [Actinomycetospora endophytica]MCD2196967.1 hypothetical protein [Actinomycetospora endophytica]